MKVCLVNPPSTQKRFEGYEWSNNTFTIQHLGLGYIAANLEKNGYKTDIIECPGRNLSVIDLCELILKENYDIVGITTYFFNFINVLRIVTNLRQRNKKIFIFLGGYLPTLCNNMVLRKARGIDCCVLGEGEYSCLELVEAISNKRDWHQIKNVSYLYRDKIITNQMRNPIMNLDELPYPKRIVLNSKFVPISTSRGCYGRCNFCGVKEFYELCNVKCMRFRSAENVVNEIEDIKNKYNPDVFLISDEIFLGASVDRKKWLRKFYDLIKERKLNIKFQALARANDLILNEDIIEKMKEIGLINIFIGTESFVQRQLDFYCKMTTVEQNIKAINILKKHKLKISLGLMIFDPYVMIDELLQNIMHLKETECFKIVDEKQEFFSIDGPVIAIPGTCLYKYLDDRNMVKDNEIKYDIQDAKAALCYEILKQWSQYIKPISNLFYLLRMAEENDLQSFVLEIKEIKTRAMKFDLDFFESLCMEIKSENVDEHNWKSFIEPYVREIDNFKHEWIDVKYRVIQEIDK